MSKNSAKIKEGLKQLTGRSYELISGVVVAGSVDASEFTCSVLPTGYDEPIEGVLLNAISESENGVILLPADNSNVIIGSIDGPGIYFLARTSDIVKAIATIKGTVLTIDERGYSIKTEKEDFTSLLKDLLNYIIAATYTNGAGTSSPANNITDFQNILTRIDNLLT